ncbi:MULTISPECIES: YibE/F family protein [Lactobacillus]|nr:MULTISPECIES: YibE/F family protein [Lactobacillus]AWM74437.1 YibE/F family protein [Lactobacillus apis]MBC6361837.1 YibE/F family protein [Lactobacillus apis]MBH9986299.1 YibE/F family protein [Lactobacillus sp. M0390]MBI0022844.1 YibE/F family protein [Lactobacillus sp. W8172]MCO6528864.1 YibE/F family protein [Lactobacillus sp.]
MSTLMALIIVLAILMTIVGGETGIRSFFSVLINTLLLILLAILISWGINIPILILIFIPLKLVTIIFLGTHDYQVAKNSFTCSFIVCLVVSVLILGCEWLAQAAGLGPEAGEILVGLSQMPGLSYPLIAVAVAIFSTLGAVAEAAVAMSSGLLEIKKHNPEISHEDLMASGSKIGNDVLGTSMNTILFGMFGSFLSLFLWYIRLNYTLGEILNEKMFVNEILIVMYSLIAVLLTVPLSTAFLAKNMVKHEVKE